MKAKKYLIHLHAGTIEQDKHLELATREQSKASIWYEYRAGRIMASKSAVHTNPAKPSQSLIFVIPIKLPFRVPQQDERTDYNIALHTMTIFLTTLAGVLHMNRMVEPIAKHVPLNTT